MKEKVLKTNTYSIVDHVVKSFSKNFLAYLYLKNDSRTSYMI